MDALQFSAAAGPEALKINWVVNGTADLDFAIGNLINVGLKRLTPTTAAVLNFGPTADFFGALGVRPEDGVIQCPLATHAV